MSNKVTGEVKWFNDNDGYGFIIPDAGGRDVFVHHDKLKDAGLHTLKEGQRVEFVVKEFKGKNQAEEIALL